MRFAAFVTPNHSTDDDPTLALERDLQLVEHLEALGFDEAWFGEHHGSGIQYIASPETFIAAASQRTHSIRLATGVAGLPFHHPVMLADRIMLLNHLSRGRVILGTGPGGPQFDAPMMGLDPECLKPRHEEALEAIIALFNTNQPIDRETDWFKIKGGRLQLRPYRERPIEVVVSALASATGPKLAGRLGTGMLSLGLLANGGAKRLNDNWQLAEETAAEHGNVMDRAGLRLAGPRMHLAATHEQAVRDVSFGLPKAVEFMVKAGAKHVSVDDDLETTVEKLNASGSVIIGTPDRAAAYLQELRDAVGDFGCYVIPTQDWADPTATRQSYELFARFVMPTLESQTASLTRAAEEFAAIVSKAPGPAAKLSRGNTGDSDNKARVADSVATG
jgi:limonene 1,2-monooxygenase